MDYNTYIHRLIIDVGFGFGFGAIYNIIFKLWWIENMIFKVISNKSELIWMDDNKNKRRDGWVTCMIDWFDWLLSKKSSSNKKRIITMNGDNND